MSAGRTRFGRIDPKAADEVRQEATRAIISKALRAVEDRDYSDVEVAAVFNALPKVIRNMPSDYGLSDGMFEAFATEWIAEKKPLPFRIEWGGSIAGTHYALHIGGSKIHLEKNGSPYLDDELAQEAATDAVAEIKGWSDAHRAVFEFEWNYTL